MDSWWNVLVEAAVLVFFGLLYYFWQKRRIISRDTIEVFEKVHQLTLTLNSYLDGKENESYYQRLNDFTTQLELALKEESIDQIIEAMKMDQGQLTEDITKQITEINHHLDFYRSSNGSSN